MKIPANLVRSAVVALGLSAGGVAFLQTEEGHSNRVYLDSVGLPTVCTGHMDRSMKVGAWYSDKECAELLRRDTGSVHAMLVRNIKVPLYQWEYDALMSFCINVGNTACATSTLFKKINRGDYAGAGSEFGRWTRAAGRDCRVRANQCYGIVLRREKERALWQGEY